jgi:hypothetical protein
MRTNQRIGGLLVLFVAAVALLIGGLRSSQAQGGKPNNNSHDFAVGAFTTMQGHFAFAAQDTTKSVPIGHVVFQDPMGNVTSGPVDCLAVSGINAAITWHDKKDSNTSYTLYVTDGGNASLDMDYADQQCDGTTCTARLAFCLVMNGNIVVNDAQ